MLLSGATNPEPPARLGRPLGTSPYEDRCIGCLLGCAAGDILGANVEFKSRAEIQRLHGQVRNFLDSDWRPLGMFTDDTEMTLALAVSLVECGALDSRHCAATYAKFFQSEPRRGYGPAISKILAMLAKGADCRSTGRAVYPDGSFGNGGPMRIAPVGLAFRHADDGVLREAVKAALLCTHVHPDAVDGAFIQAKAVAHLARSNAAPGIDVAAFLSDLRSRATRAVVGTKLDIVMKAHARGWSDDELLASICTPNEYGEQFQIHAAEAVACGLWAFACCHGEPEECVIRAVSLGGDTDTIATMAGALAGALHGSSWLPRRWFEQMENQPDVGRDHLIGVAQRLAELDLRSVLTLC